MPVSTACPLPHLYGTKNSFQDTLTQSIFMDIGRKARKPSGFFMKLLVHIAAVCSVVSLLCSGCLLEIGGGSGGDSSVRSDEVFSTTSFTVFSCPPAWSPDGSTLVFSGNRTSASTDTVIWKVRAAPGSDPVPIDVGGAHCPSYLSDGRIAYFTGWRGADLDMHIMVVDSAGSAAPSVLHSFNGSDVDMAHNEARTPLRMSLSDNGLYAFLIWAEDSAYTLRWTSAGDLLDPHRFTQPMSCGMISPDGQTVAYYNTDLGKVVYQESEGGIERTVGIAECPTWAARSDTIGYVSGSTYEIYAIGSSDRTWYTLDANVHNASLAPGAGMFAYRTRSGSRDGLALGILTSE
ncbi:MAG: hypothetical protein GF418_09635 [Chitinivibrionales bacterium]|nr:hypothetical protein [Chitinivibrionales bacterium]MBD3395871.1 hypothetical protein [Chitinivibrionales bacterium]